MTVITRKDDSVTDDDDLERVVSDAVDRLSHFDANAVNASVAEGMDFVTLQPVLYLNLRMGHDVEHPVTFRLDRRIAAHIASELDRLLAVSYEKHPDGD